MSKVAVLLAICLLPGIALCADAGAGNPLTAVQKVLFAWQARSNQQLPVVEIVFTYAPKVLPGGQQITLAESSGGSLGASISASTSKTVKVRVQTDGRRFHSELLPNKDGIVEMPGLGNSSPYVIYDGKLFAYSSGNGIAITDKYPSLGYPLPFDFTNLVPVKVAMLSCPQWSEYCNGSFYDWFTMMLGKNGKVDVTEDNGGYNIKAVYTYPGSVSQEVVSLEGDPLQPRRVVAGFARAGAMQRFTEVTFKDYTTFEGWVLPKEMVATLKLNMAKSPYVEVPTYAEKLKKLKADGISQTDVIALLEHRLTIESIRKSEQGDSAFKLPLTPGVAVFDHITNRRYVWGEKLESLEKQLNK